ncbi:alpha/beta hydrolase [Microbulbifer sp. THAF38]|uniref:alpha/beta hydrolase n=1 Tax=Microbulbifer sp. THAF38 TaxID=2587856 RepID=UPI0012689D13|nr:alpha/beta hydrolase-fold protein [Microbulbifer sp. THAF38]QFT55881.1 Ferri-bacillibactin esterase BesA [Microbulbifer sp. THAF38]
MKSFISTLFFFILLTSLTGCYSDSHESELSFNQAHTLEFLPALKGDYFKMESKNVGRAYHIYIRFPEGYHSDQKTQEIKKSYPIIYLLDGDSLFPILAANHLFLSYDDLVPEAIVVGIAYGSFDPEINKRSYDFSLPAADNDPERGGAEKFLNFLEGELLPTVESRYLADPNQRVLFGQSRGGHFVLYTAFTRPNLFKGFIASNPTFLPQKDFFYGKPHSANRDDLNLVITSGENDTQKLRGDALTWNAHWSKQEEMPWEITFKTIPAGSHAANSTDSYRLGLNVIFRDEIAQQHHQTAGGAHEQY